MLSADDLNSLSDPGAEASEAKQYADAIQAHISSLQAKLEYPPAIRLGILGGIVGTYGGGGFVQDLDLSKNSSLAILQFLSDNVWLDRGTRAVMLDFTVYNANINLFCQIRFLYLID
jgi:hypothetical protein